MVPPAFAAFDVQLQVNSVVPRSRRSMLFGVVAGWA